MLFPSLFTPQAWQDALEIVEYVGTDNPEAASLFACARDVFSADALASVVADHIERIPYSVKSQAVLDYNKIIL